MSCMVEKFTDVSEERTASISRVCFLIAFTASSSTPNKKALHSSETSVNLYQTKQRHTSEYSSLNKEFTSS
jgi:hypothetical protein